MGFEKGSPKTKESGRQGGLKKSSKKGFGSNPKLAKEMGKKGWAKMLENYLKSQAGQ